MQIYSSGKEFFYDIRDVAGSECDSSNFVFIKCLVHTAIGSIYDLASCGRLRGRAVGLLVAQLTWVQQSGYTRC